MVQVVKCNNRLTCTQHLLLEASTNKIYRISEVTMTQLIMRRGAKIVNLSLRGVTVLVSLLIGHAESLR